VCIFCGHQPAVGNSQKLRKIPPFSCSILNQIIRVSDEVVDFRRSIATKNGSLSGADFSEDLERTPDDPMPPLASSIWASSKDVTPRELPDRFFSVPSPQPPRDKTNSTKADNNVKPVTTTSSTKPLKNTQEDNMSDNMSGVSMATSSLTSEDTVGLRIKKAKKALLKAIETGDYS
jgi:hypothetical protein